MTRERLPSGNILQKGYVALEKFKINRTFFVKTDQEGCFLAASDINASNGITSQSTVPEFSGSDQRDEAAEGLRTAGVLEGDKPVAVKENEIKPQTTEIKPETLEIKPSEHTRPVKPVEIKEEPKPEAATLKVEKVEKVEPETPKVEEVKPIVEEKKEEKVPVVSVPDHILSATATKA